jgi:nucleoside-diphosphate-sugar epimerase
MRVFLTGATGFIGSFLVPELVDAGHHVVGLSRSDAGAAALTRAGAEVFRGDVNDPDRLRTAAEATDGVVHTAFNHDFSNLKQNSEDDRKVIETLGQALAGSDRPLVIASGTGLARSKTGGPAVETDRSRHLGRVPPRSLRGGGRRPHRRRRARDGGAAGAGPRHAPSGPGRTTYPVGAATRAGGVCRRGQEPLARRARL